MPGSKIARRILGSFLLLTFTGLVVLGLVLMNYFQRERMMDEQKELATYAHVIALGLKDGTYELRGDLDAPVEEFSALTGLRVTILDETGAVLAESDHGAASMENHRERPEVQQALAGSTGTATRYSQTLDENMLYVAIPYYDNGRFAGVIRTATSLRTIEEAMHRTMTVLLLAFIASVVLAVYLARRQLRPILAIIAAARGIMSGDLARRITVHMDDEFDILIRALNQLAERLQHKIDEARTENEKLNLILENMDNGVLLFDEQDNIQGANRRVRQIFSLEKASFGRHSIHVLGSAVLSETAQEVRERGASKTCHLKLDVQGHVHTFRVYFATFVARGRTCVMAVLHDISLMEEMHARQSAFVSNAAHELRTPLTSVRGFAEFLADDDFSDPETSHHAADVIERESERMERLVQSLLELARLDDADLRHRMERTPVDAGAALQDAADELLPRAQKKQQQVDVLIETQAKLLANEDLFGQILRNLIENAIKYTPEGGRIALSCTEAGQDIQLAVEDNGIGIAREDLPRIFDRFYRVDKARARASGGNGIGLALVKYLVKLFKGTIRVESELGKGTRFTVRFPKMKEPA